MVTKAEGPSLSDSAEGCSLLGLTLHTKEEHRVSCSLSSSAKMNPLQPLTQCTSALRQELETLTDSVYLDKQPLRSLDL